MNAGMDDPDLILIGKVMKKWNKMEIIKMCYNQFV